MDNTEAGTTSPKEMAAAAAQTAKEQVASIADLASRKTREQIESQKRAAADTLDEFANAIRHAGEELAQHDQTLAGRMVKQAADGLERFSRSVADKRPEELLDAVRDFGRRNPLALVAGSVLAGVALARFLRSSSQHDHSTATRTETETFRPDQGQGFSSARSGGVVEQPSVGPEL